MATKRKNPAAVALGRKGGRKGGAARAASLTPEQRSESARKAVRARWAKAKARAGRAAVERTNGTSKNSARRMSSSDEAVLDLLKRIQATSDPTEIQRMSGQLERAIFHKQFKNA